MTLKINTLDNAKGSDTSELKAFVEVSKKKRTALIREKTVIKK